MFEKLKEDLKKPTAQYIDELCEENDKLHAEIERLQSLVERAKSFVEFTLCDTTVAAQWLKDVEKINDCN